jgi:hypothetical protein
LVQMPHMKISTVLTVLFFLLIILCCSKPKVVNVRLVDLPDSVLVHFSYALFPEGGFHGYVKQTSLYNSTLPVLQTAGSFTAPGAREALISVPYISIGQGAFYKLFIVKITGKNYQLIDWFQNDCNTYSITDIDDDGTQEIITTYEYKDQENVLRKNYEIFGLEGDTNRILYQSESEDSRNGDRVIELMNGDTLLDWKDHALVHTNGDSILQLQQIRKWILKSDAAALEKIDTTIIDLKLAGVVM